SWHDQIDNLIKLINAAALLGDVTIRHVTRHFAVADTPSHPALRIKPDELLGFLLNLPQHPIVRSVIVVAPVADDQDRGLAIHRGKKVFIKLLEGATKIRMRKHIDDVALEGSFDRGLNVIDLEQLGHLADLGDENKAPHLGIEILDRVDELQHKAGRI